MSTKFLHLYAPHLCLVFLVGNALKNASCFVKGQSALGYCGANDQSLFCKCRPLCHCFLGYLSMLCLCWSFPFGPQKQRLGFDVGITFYALVDGVVYGGCLWLLSTSSGCVLFLVAFIPNSGTTGDAEYALLHRLWFLCVCKDTCGCTLDIVCTDQGCRSNSARD